MKRRPKSHIGSPHARVFVSCSTSLPTEPRYWVSVPPPLALPLLRVLPLGSPAPASSSSSSRGSRRWLRHQAGLKADGRMRAYVGSGDAGRMQADIDCAQGVWRGRSNACYRAARGRSETEVWHWRLERERERGVENTSREVSSIGGSWLSCDRKWVG
jgi:hypothetical protein